MTFKYQEQQVDRGGGALRRRRPGWRLWWPSNWRIFASVRRGHQRLAAEARGGSQQEEGGDAVAHQPRSLRRASSEKGRRDSGRSPGFPSFDQDGGFGGHCTGGRTGASEGEATEDLRSLRSKFGAFYTCLFDNIVQTTCFLIGHVMI